MFPTLSEAVTGTRLTVAEPFFNKWMIPIGLTLLLLTGIGPLLAWRKTSKESLKRNFLIPAVSAVAVVIFLVLTPHAWGGPFGLRPWEDISSLYALMTIALGVLVLATVVSEFVRGGRVFATQMGSNLAAGMVQLTRRNTRRYGGYIAHFGFALVLIGFAGAAFNQDIERELGNGDRMSIGPYTLTCKSWTEDSNPNYNSRWAIIDVTKNGQPLTTMYPEQRFYNASQTTQTMVANRSTLKEDLYIVFSGMNEDTGKPIIKAHLNPLVSWVWIGIIVLVLGTVLALLPNAVPVRAAARVPVAHAVEEPVGAAR